MIKFEFFTYTDAQWNAIKEQMLDDLGVDADQIERQITPSVGKFSITAMQPLRDRVEVTMSQYRLNSAVNRLSPRRDEMEILLKNAKNMHASIISALSVPLDVGRGVVEPMLFNGVDADMLDATSDYIRKLAANIARMNKQAGRHLDNARKTARDQCWKELRAIWIELGGKPRGIAVAEFIKLASLPVMNSVPTVQSVKQWLERHPAQ